MSKTVLITGAGGNIGSKLRRHFEHLGWTLRLLDGIDRGDPAIAVHDLSVWDDAWVKHFADVDCVVHLAGDPRTRADFASVQKNNIDLVMNVYEAAARRGAKRLVFASSNWVVAGHRFGTEPLTDVMPPYPVNPYGMSKLFGERIGRSFHERWGLSVVCFRIGYNQPNFDNQPGTHMGWGVWGQRMWLSDRDLCQGCERAVLAGPDLGFAVLNLVSNNDGMRWDLERARQAIGYEPMDRWTPVETDTMQAQTASALNARRLVEATETFIIEQRW